jgi:hypothetical protein
MIPLGEGPVPATSAELQERIAGGVQRALAASSADGILVGASMESPQVVPLVAITLVDVTADSVPSLPAAGLPSLGRAVVGEVRVEAQRLRLRGVPVDVSASAADVPMAWRTAFDGLWLLPDQKATTATAAGAPSGDLRLSVPVAALEDAVRAEVAREVESRGFSLKSFSLGIRQTGPNALELSSVATVGKAFLKATVTVTGRARIDESLALVVDGVGIASGNPIVSAFLGPVESRLAPWNGRRIESASYSFAGARLTEAELTVDSSVHLRVHAG